MYGNGSDGVGVSVSVGVSVIVGVPVGAEVLVGVKVNVRVGVSVGNNWLSGRLEPVNQIMSRMTPMMTNAAAP